jgi:phage tail-like protein
MTSRVENRRSNCSLRWLLGLAFASPAAIAEGGENRFVHRLPKTIKHPLLELKRGIAPQTSALVGWCKSVLEFGKAIETKAIVVLLLDPDGKPLLGWQFSDAYPVKWEISDFNSMKNEVTIETISLSYTFSKRL